MISLTCDYHPATPVDATIHHPTELFFDHGTMTKQKFHHLGHFHHSTEILSSGTHVSSSQEPKVVKSFLAESHDQKWCVPLLPICQKSWKIENQNFGGHFPRRICLLRPKSHSSSKEGSLSSF